MKTKWQQKNMTLDMSEEIIIFCVKNVQYKIAIEF